MDLPAYLYGARKENGPTPQLAKDFVLAFGLLFTALCQTREVTSDSQIYWVRHVLKAIGLDDITAMADTFRRFEARPSFMIDHPAFDFFWAFLLPGGAPLIPEARGATVRETGGFRRTWRSAVSVDRGGRTRPTAADYKVAVTFQREGAGLELSIKIGL